MQADVKIKKPFLTRCCYIYACTEYRFGSLKPSINEEKMKRIVTFMKYYVYQFISEWKNEVLSFKKIYK